MESRDIRAWLSNLLVEAANALRRLVRPLLGPILHGVRFSTSNGRMVRSISEIGSLSRTLVHASMDAAQMASRQRQRVLEVVTTEQEIRVAAQQSVANSRAVSERTEAVGANLDEGNRTIEATNRSMSEMVGTVTAGADLMQGFVARMAEVNRVVAEIGGFARQTNLLALNAAIEAAHAGKEGEGFNVIAQEIRLLADRAGRSASEIEANIGLMAQSAGAAAKAMQTGRAAAAASIEENLAVQRSLTSIRSAMQDVQRMSAQVASASEGQIAAGDRVLARVMEVDEMVAGSSLDADAAAEMSIKMVWCASRVHGQLEGRAKNEGRRGTDLILQQVEDQEPGMHQAMALLRAECANAGTAALRGEMEVKGIALPGLHFGVTPATVGMKWVDRVNQRTGCGATIFVLDGDRFVRVATNVKTAAGERATGTVLNPKGLAVRQLRRSRGHFGAVYVLGNPFVAAYEPVLSTTGQLIGALYVGRALEWEYGG